MRGWMIVPLAGFGERLRLIWYLFCVRGCSWVNSAVKLWAESLGCLLNLLAIYRFGIVGYE